MSVKNKSLLLIILLILADQISKFYIKLSFPLSYSDYQGDHNSIQIFNWFKLFFVENEGAAFGMKIIGKLFLTLFRIVAVGVLGVFIHRLIKRGARTGFILAVSVLLAGAAGNIIDSVFYGVIFSESTIYQAATLFPEGGGYAPIFYGKVVDMLYFPLISDSAGNTIFFKWIFNIADSCVSVSVVIILLFFRKELNESLENKKSKENIEPKENE